MRKIYLLFLLAFNFLGGQTMAQTTLNAGDIAFVAYRANASGSGDQAAFITFVNLAEGTQINFTDAKYTDNVQAQCAGGFTWTAPSGGVAAGSVIILNVDATPVTASVGSVAGSSFGLSSGGDQVIAYQGTAASPTHISALSTNAWATTTLTTCSGSFSKIPATLTDGTDAINLSAAPGNTSNNTVNAYYNGSQIGATANLRANINNSANWVGIGAATPPQTWPTFSFPGPPSVASASTPNQTTIKVVFNSIISSASATNLANYTGLAGLSTATLEADNKTVTLVFTTPFASTGNSLVINGVQDNDGRSMFTAYTFNFNYQTSVKFDKKFVRVDESAGTVSIKVIVTNPTTSSIEVVAQTAPSSTAGASDHTYTTQTLTFTGASVTEHFITVPITNDTENEQDEYLALKFTTPTNLTTTGGDYFTLFIKDNDRTAPVGTKEIELSLKSSFDPGSSTAEIVVHDPTTQRIYIISSVQDRFDIADFSNPAAITLIKSVDMTTYGGITSIAVRNGVVAVACPATIPTDNGSVVFFNSNGDFQKQVTVGSLPDNISFTPDGSKIVTANEGQPSDDYTIDPEGSASIIDISGGIATLDQTKVKTLEFKEFNSQEAQLKATGVRKLKSTSTMSQDFEPEFVTYSPDSKKAWVTLQESNAIAEIDLATQTVTSIWGLGKKDMGTFGNGFDASDNNGVIVIANWPVKSFYIPDAISHYSLNNVNYLVTANEGDEKEYAGYNERTTVSAVTLDPTAFPNGAMLKENHNLGRFRITNNSGDTDGDGDYDELNSVGTRSFTIWNADTKTKVFDSGDAFEQITAADPVYGALFNSDHEANGFKTRSRSKGPEPEGVTVAQINDKFFAFVSLERIGGVMVYDITDPANVKFVDYKNNRSTSAYTGDHGPEGLVYVKRENSPDNKAYILVANEISGSVSVYEITPTPKLDQTITFTAPTTKTVGDAAFSLTATSTSTLPVTFSTTDNEVTINGSQVTIVKGGKVTIAADQAGNASYNKAVTVTQSFCVNPAKPVITLSSGNNTETVTLQSSATEGNQWFKDGALIAGQTATTLQVTTPGTYTVQSTVETCASAVSEQFLLVITDIEPSNNGKLINLYPNPVEETLFIQVPIYGKKSLQVVTANGTEQIAFTSEKDVIELDVRSLSKGLYIVNISTKNGLLRGRFVKK